MGYSTKIKGYKCYNKMLHNTIDCIDMKVDEELPNKN